MDYQRLALAAAVLVIGLGGYYGWPWLKTVVAKWRAGSTPAAPSGPSHQAYDAVLVLIDHFKRTGCKEGEASARQCGTHLFHSGPHETARPSLPDPAPVPTLGLQDTQP